MTPHAQPAARAPNETLSGNHHILSSRAREHCTPSKISRLLHGKLEGGELQVNSIVPLLTFGLFARTWVSLTLPYSYIHSVFTLTSLTFTPTLKWCSVCLHGRPSGTCSPSSGWNEISCIFNFFNKFKDLDNLLKSRGFQLIWMNNNQQGWLSNEDNHY